MYIDIVYILLTTTEVLLVIILGIDPGYAIVGYGVIDFKLGKYKLKDQGAIFTKSSDKFIDRLEKIFNNISEILRNYNPDAVAIEKLYFQNNQKTAIEVSEARGVILLACKKYTNSIYEYTPLQVKTAVTGYGRAQKQQVMSMVKRLLSLKDMPYPDDTADALAIAVCHANSSGIRYINDIVVRGGKKA